MNSIQQITSTSKGILWSVWAKVEMNYLKSNNRNDSIYKMYIVSLLNYCNGIFILLWCLSYIYYSYPTGYVTCNCPFTSEDQQQTTIGYT